MKHCSFAKHGICIQWKREMNHANDSTKPRRISYSIVVLLNEFIHMPFYA